MDHSGPLAPIRAQGPLVTLLKLQALPKVQSTRRTQILRALRTLGALGALGALGTLGMLGTLGKLGTLGTLGTLGKLGKLGKLGTLGSYGAAGARGADGGHPMSCASRARHGPSAREGLLPSHRARSAGHAQVALPWRGSQPMKKGAASRQPPPHNTSIHRDAG